ALGARLAFARQADAVAGIDTGRHLDRQGLVFLDATLVVTVVTGVGDHLAAAMAARAGLLHREEALLHAHLTDAAAGAAGGRAAALLGPGSTTGLAVGQGRYANGHRGAAHGLFQTQLQGVAQGAAPLRTPALTATGTTEE